MAFPRDLPCSPPPGFHQCLPYSPNRYPAAELFVVPEDAYF